MILLLPYSVYPAISVGNPKINSNVNQIKTIPLNMDELPLPRTARDIFRLSLKDRLIFGSVTAFNRWTGRWRYPVAASGDLETMKKIDIIYWLYKAEFPHTRAVKDSGLEAFFERQKSFQYSLPVNYTIANELKLSAAGDLMDHPYLSNSSATKLKTSGLNRKTCSSSREPPIVSMRLCVDMFCATSVKPMSKK